MDEAALIARLPAGDREALGELLMAHREACYALALRLTARAEDAEDVCQDAFVRASRDAAGFHPSGSFRSWLFGLVVCAHRDRLRSERARRRREGERAMEREAATVAEAGGIEQAELRMKLDRALKELDERRALPIILHYERGLSHAETAAALAMPEGTVKTNIHRGLEELRGVLARSGFGAAVLGAGLVEDALSRAPEVIAPASLAIFIGSLTSGAAGAKAAAGAAATAAGGIALVWKLAAGVTLAAALGAGGWAGWRHLRPAAAPAPEPRPAAAPELPPGEALRRPVTLALRGAGYRDALSRVSDQTGLVWTPPNDHLVPARGVTLKAEGTPARKVLDELARSAGLVWKESPEGVAVFNQECPDFEARRRSLEEAAGGDEAVRAEALYRLGYCGDMRALPHLAKAMADRSLLVRCWAAVLLKDCICSERSVRVDRHAAYRHGRTVDSWVQWLGAEERAALVTALLAPDALPSGIRSAGMSRFSGTETRFSLLACLDDDARARAAILKGLESREATEREAAVWACRLSPREAYGERLLAMIPAVTDRMEILRLAGALGCFPGERCRREWLKLQSEKVAGLGQVRSGIGSEDAWAIPELLATIRSGPPGRIYDTAGALEKFAGSDRAAEISARLAARYREGTTKQAVSKYLLAALARFGRPEGREALLSTMEHPVNGLDLCETLDAAARWPGPDEKLEEKVLALAKSEDPKYSEVRRRAALAMGSLGGRRSAEFLADLARKASDDTWKWPSCPAMTALGVLSQMQARLPEARAALAELAEKAPSRRLAAHARTRLPPGTPEGEAAELLRAAAEAAKAPEAERTEHRAMIGLLAQRSARVGGEPVIAAFRKMSSDDSPLVRAAAASGMRWCPERVFADELVRLAGDADKDVASAAASTLAWKYFRGWAGEAQVERLLAGDAKGRLAALRAMGGMASWQSVAEHFGTLEKLAAGEGEERTLARRILAATGWPGTSPRAVGWIIAELKSEDPSRRKAARLALQGNLHDPRAAPAIEEHAKAHPDEVRRPLAGPEPVKPPEPPEVF